MSYKSYAFLLAFLLLVPSITSAKSLQKPPNNLGLVGYWSFNEGSGTIATDFSGRGNRGTLTNGPQWTGGKLGGAISFDGSDDQVDVANAAILTQGTKGSISAWVRANSLGADFDYIYSENIAAGAVHHLRCDNSLCSFTIRQSNDTVRSTTSSAPLVTGRWFHLMGTFDASIPEMKFYIDGVLMDTETLWDGTIKTSIVKSLIGDITNAGVFSWNGAIDDVRIYNRTLTASDVGKLYTAGAAKFNSQIQPQGSNLSNGLVGHWTFDGKYLSSTIATDTSGQGNNGTLTGGPRPAFGRLGQALQFDGTDDYVDAGSGISTSNITAMTQSVWIKNAAAAANKAVLGWYVTDGLFLQTLTSANDGLLALAGGGSAHGSLAIQTVGKWVHVVLVYDGSQSSDATRLKMFVDGVQQTLSFGGAIPASITTSGSLKIGDVGALDRKWNGSIDDVRIYNRALTAGEVKQLYGVGATKFNSQTEKSGTSLASGLVGHWTFDGKYLSSTTATDTSGQGNHGALTNGPRPTFGRLGQALQFDGADDYVDVGDINATDGASALTACVWARPASLNNIKTIAAKFSGNGWIMETGQTGTIGSFSNGIIVASNASAYGVTGDNVLTVGVWNHLCMVFNGAEIGDARLKLFANGASQPLTYTGTQPATLENTTHSVTIGTRADASFPLDASIDDARIYNRALTAGEVKQLYDLGR